MQEQRKGKTIMARSSTLMQIIIMTDLLWAKRQLFQGGGAKEKKMVSLGAT